MRWQAPTSLSAVALLLLLPLPAAEALPLPLNPDDPAVTGQWINPLLRAGESDEQLSIQLRSATTGPLAPGEELELSFTLHNHTGEPVTGLSLQPQRGAASHTTAGARQVIGYEAGAYPHYATPIDLAPLAAGESRELRLSIPTAPGAPGSLGIPGPGTYPLLFGLNSPLGFSSERFLLSVREEEPAEVEEAGPGVSLLYPLASRTDILPGETGDAPEATPLILGSEDLAGELAPGGRLYRLLAEYRAASSRAELRDATCLGVDPALLDTVERMSRGYLVDDSRPVEIQAEQRLRDSWTGEKDRDPATPGTGQAEAGAWLQELRELAGQGCILALPWGNADLDAVGATADQWLMREALERGPALIREVLDVEPLRNVVVPGSGYVDPDTAPALGWAAGEGELAAAWEQAAATRGAGSTAAGNGDGAATLDDTTLPTGDPATLPPVPATTVNVLVAENTLWQDGQVDRFAELAPGIRAVSYQGSLAATLAATGPLPETVGYSNPATRFDFRIDSPAARDLSAAATIRLAATEQQAAGAEPLLLMPPTAVSADTAGMVLDTLGDLLDTGDLSPLPLRDYLSPDPEQAEQLAATAPTGDFGAPYTDPTTFSDAEVLRASQQATYTDDLTRIMSNDPVISLTRYGYTAPLRRDLLLALTGLGRRSYASHWESVLATDRRLSGNREVLQALRGSVSLIPPGNVYTRASESSPLLIVAQNQLPLPARAKISYRGPEGVGLNVPTEIRIPAQGSISLQMTADLPADRDRTDLVLWLSTSDGAAISDPVEISVQTRSWTVGTSGAAVLLVLALALALIFRLGLQRRRRHTRRTTTGQAPAPTTTARPTRRARPRRATGHADEDSGSPRPPGRP